MIQTRTSSDQAMMFTPPSTCIVLPVIRLASRRRQVGAGEVKVDYVGEFLYLRARSSLIQD